MKLIYFLSIVLLVYLFYLFFVILRKSKVEKFDKSSAARIVISMGKLNSINNKTLANLIGLTNGVIIATVYMFAITFDSIYIMLIVSALAVIPATTILYYILAMILKRSE